MCRIFLFFRKYDIFKHSRLVMRFLRRQKNLEIFNEKFISTAF